MSQNVKNLFERSLCGLGLHRLGRVFRGSNSLVLAYHNVIQDDAEALGETSLHLPFRCFQAQLDLLTESCEVVALSEVLEPTSGSEPTPRIAITFDDAYRGAIRLALPELRRRGLPATVFVAPRILGGRVFWWDALLSNHTEELRTVALEDYHGKPEAVRGWADRMGLVWREPGSDTRSSTLVELESAVGDAITVGSHGWSHADLSRLSPEKCRAELTRSMGWLEKRFSSFVPWLSYPYGAHSTAAEAVARECGYEGAYRISGGWIRDSGVERFALPRLNVPAGLSLEGFALRLAGLLC